MRIVTATLFVALTATTTGAFDLSTKELSRIDEAAAVLKEIHGAQTIDLVLLAMNKRGMEKMLRTKVTLGAEASVAGGPVGRDARAATDGLMKAEILSYSRTQGLFAGVNLSGGIVKADLEDNRDLYGPDVSPRDIVMNGSAPLAPETEAFMAALPR